MLLNSHNNLFLLSLSLLLPLPSFGAYLSSSRFSSSASAAVARALRGEVSEAGHSQTGTDKKCRRLTGTERLRRKRAHEQREACCTLRRVSPGRKQLMLSGPLPMVGSRRGSIGSKAVARAASAARRLSLQGEATCSRDHANQVRNPGDRRMVSMGVIRSRI